MEKKNVVCFCAVTYTGIQTKLKQDQDAESEFLSKEEKGLNRHVTKNDMPKPHEKVYNAIGHCASYQRPATRLPTPPSIPCGVVMALVPSAFLLYREHKVSLPQ